MCGDKTNKVIKKEYVIIITAIITAIHKSNLFNLYASNGQTMGQKDLNEFKFQSLVMKKYISES